MPLKKKIQRRTGKNALTQFKEGIVKTLIQIKRRAAWQWADENRYLPPGSAFEGKWKSSRFPWVIGITEAVALPAYSEICIIMSAQMSKTEGVHFNLIACWIVDSPAPIIFLGPTKHTSESISKDRFRSMIEYSTDLKDALPEFDKSAITERRLFGFPVRFAWAGSASSIASNPAKYILVDELDRMADDVKQEGSAKEIVKARNTTYANGKYVVTSTPKEGIIEVHDDDGLLRWGYADLDRLNSQSWEIFQSATRHEYAVPCAGCKEYIIPKSHIFYYDKNLEGTDLENSASIRCNRCGYHNKESDKSFMIQRGVFVAPGQKPLRYTDQHVIVLQAGKEHKVRFSGLIETAQKTSKASVWVSGLLSPTASLGRRARSLSEARKNKNPHDERAVLNTEFGELFSIIGVIDNFEIIYNKKGGYLLGEFPERIQRLAMLVDVQEKSLVYTVRGYGYGGTSWLVDYGYLETRDTAELEVWEDLWSLYNKKIHGKEIDLMLIDSGFKPGRKAHAPHRVYQFAERDPEFIFPTKGYLERTKKYEYSKVDTNKYLSAYELTQPKTEIIIYSTDYFKVQLQSEIKEKNLGSFGEWYVPDDINEDYAKQMTSEKRVVNKGKIEWVKIREHNHFFDTEVLSCLASEILKVRNEDYLFKLEADYHHEETIRTARETA